MDVQFDPWKIFSLGIFGSAPEAFHRATPLTVEQLENVSLPDFFLLAPDCSPEETVTIINALKERGVFEARVIGLELSQVGKKFESPFYAAFPICLTEDIEDTKIRFAMLLEKQRWKLLNEYLWNKKTKTQSQEEESDAIFFLHSFCLGLGIKLSDHQNCFQRSEKNLHDLNSHEILDLLVILAKEISLKIAQPTDAREILKVQTAHLPFRLRTEVRAHVERSLERLWKGSGNAA